MRYMNGQPPLGPNVRRFNTQEEVDAFNRQQQKQPIQQPPQPYNYLPTTSTGGPTTKISREDVKAWVWALTFFPGLILVFVTIFTLNIYAMIPGFILFAVCVGIMSWEQGSHAVKHQNNRHTNASTGWSDVYMNRCGSYNAKRNMWRGYRYSKRKIVEWNFHLRIFFFAFFGLQFFSFLVLLKLCTHTDTIEFRIKSLEVS